MMYRCASSFVKLTNRRRRRAPAERRFVDDPLGHDVIDADEDEDEDGDGEPKGGGRRGCVVPCPSSMLSATAKNCARDHTEERALWPPYPLQPTAHSVHGAQGGVRAERNLRRGAACELVFLATWQKDGQAMIGERQILDVQRSQVAGAVCAGEAEKQHCSVAAIADVVRCGCDETCETSHATMVQPTGLVPVSAPHRRGARQTRTRRFHGHRCEARLPRLVNAPDPPANPL